MRTRTVKNDNTISFDNHPLQLPPAKNRCSFAKAKVALYQHLNAGLTVHYKDVQIARFEQNWQVHPRACGYSHKEVQTKRKIRMGVNNQKSISNYSPGKDHPWKQNYGYWLNGKLICQKDLVESG